MRTADFHFDLPESAIAQRALEPRDASRLLVTSTTADHQFCELPDLLRAGDLLVVNRTRVRAARIVGRRSDTDGRIEALLLRRVDDARWEALIRRSRRLRPGVVIEFEQAQAEVLTEPVRGVVTLRLDTGGRDPEALLEEVGEVPLPPYFHGHLADAERYQTVFADEVGSAAAPTAALHFTPSLIDRLREVDVPIATVELQIGLDTFRPIGVDDIRDHEMHRERYAVPPDTATQIAATREGGGRVIGVGTTVVRTLESAATGNGRVEVGRGTTDLFIAPGYRPRVVDAVITNFHAPGTTLIVMIAALVGERWRALYETAIDRGYRFLSFGDSMFIDDPVARRG